MFYLFLLPILEICLEYFATTLKAGAPGDRDYVYNCDRTSLILVLMTHSCHGGLLATAHILLLPDSKLEFSVSWVECDRSVSNLLATQPWGPELDPWNPYKKSRGVVAISNWCGKKRETGESRRIHWAASLDKWIILRAVRDHFSTDKVNGSWGVIGKADLWHPHTDTHARTHSCLLPHSTYINVPYSVCGMDWAHIPLPFAQWSWGWPSRFYSTSDDFNPV